MTPTGQQILGSYTFYWDPDHMTIPEKKKDIAVQKTYGGSAIFEWSAVLQGTKVELRWNYMPRGMYKKLRELYIPDGQTYEWNPQVGGNTYNIRIIDLKGGYHEVVQAAGKFRPDIVMVFDIRGLNKILQSTTTTTSTTTTV